MVVGLADSGLTAEGMMSLSEKMRLGGGSIKTIRK